MTRAAGAQHAAAHGAARLGADPEQPASQRAPGDDRAPPDDRPSHDGLTPSRYEGLIAALTLSPATYSRNRFFELYRDPEVRRIRRRAGQLRSLVTALAASAKREVKGRVIAYDERADGSADLAYEVEALGLKRKVWLDPLELSLVRYGISRAGEAPPGLGASPHDSARIEEALRCLVAGI